VPRSEGVPRAEAAPATGAVATAELKRPRLTKVMTRVHREPSATALEAMGVASKNSAQAPARQARCRLSV
jgi:hypothetical protein